MENQVHSEARYLQDNPRLLVFVSIVIVSEEFGKRRKTR